MANTRSGWSLALLACCATAMPRAAFGDDDLTPADRLTAAAAAHRLPLSYDGVRFGGPAWERLLEEARAAHFFSIGEEHGIAENAKLAAQLFTTLVDAGYEKLVIEVSPPMGRVLDRRLAADGLEGLRVLFAEAGGEPAFFGMREEAEMLATVRAALPPEGEVLWGVDYEVASDRVLLRQLEATARPSDADAPLAELDAASANSWRLYQETRSPQHIFSFAGDPELATRLRQAWRGADAATADTLITLEETLAINRLWIEGRAWESNARRAALIRANFLRHWRDAIADGDRPRVMLKLGSSHLVRGRNMTGTFDLGSLLPEIAAVEGLESFSMMVLPGVGSLTAVLDPAGWTYSARPAKDAYADGLDAITDAALPGVFTLIDLEPLRPVVGNRTGAYDARLLQVVHGFDMLLVMSGSTASGEFEHP